MRGRAELSWHTGANYILGLDEQAHIQKANRERSSFQRRGYRSAAFMLIFVFWRVAASELPFTIHIPLCRMGIKIYISVCWCLDYHWSWLLSKHLGWICHASLLQPHPRDKSEGHETGKADKNKSLINIWALNAKPFLFRLCLRAHWEWQFFFLICAHIVEKLQANVLAIDHTTNRCWWCISKVTVWIQTFSTTVQWLIRLMDVKSIVKVSVLL